METKRVHKNCKTEVIEVSRPSPEYPDLWQYQCPKCDPNRKGMFGKKDTEIIEAKGSTYEDRIEMMRKEKEGEEKGHEETTFIMREKPRIRGEII